MDKRLTEQELVGKIHSAVHQQCQKRGYAAPADVLVDIGVLPKQNMRTGVCGSGQEDCGKIYDVTGKCRARSGRILERVRGSLIKDNLCPV